MNYQDTCDTLVKRISNLIPKHPEILKMKNPRDLFKIEEFNYDNLELSLAEASLALESAKSGNS